MGDNDSIKVALVKRPRPVFEISDYNFTGRLWQVNGRQRAGRLVDRRERMAPGMKPAGVPSAAAGYIQHTATGFDQVRPALNPPRRWFRTVGVLHGRVNRWCQKKVRFAIENIALEAANVWARDIKSIKFDLNSLCEPPQQ